MFSAEDGTWGAASGEVDGAFACLSDRSEGSWGQENCAGDDSGCNIVYVDGKPRRAPDLLGKLYYGTSPLAHVDEAARTFEGNVTDRGSYGHEVLYTPGASGLYLLSVTLGGQHIDGSPFRVTVSTGIAVAHTSSAKGVGLRHAIAGEIARFTVVARDVESNQITTGGEPFDATIDGKLEIFKKISIEDAIQLVKNR